MFDASSELRKFYRNEVILPAKVVNDLRNKSKLNVDRLNEGLKEYNSENNTDYKIAETRIQGGLSMYTAVQNDKNDCDIDVAIVFEKNNIDSLGPLAARNIVANALKKKTSQFNVKPEVKTGCIRIRYADGYHIDFAVYRRYKKYTWSSEYTYEYAGAEWSVRGIKAVEEWFQNEVDNKGNNLNTETINLTYIERS